MSVSINGIYFINPTSLDFSIDGGDDSDTVHPKAAYEITALVENKRFDTYGVVWILDDDKPAAFIDEDFEAYLLDRFTGQIKESHIQDLNDLILRKYFGEDLELPYSLF